MSPDAAPATHHVTMTLLRHPDDDVDEALGELGMDLVGFGWTLHASIKPGSPPPGCQLTEVRMEGPSVEEALELIRERAIELGALA